MNPFHIEEKALQALKLAFPTHDVTHFVREVGPTGVRIEFRFSDATDEGKAAAGAAFDRKATLLGFPTGTLGHQYLFKKRIYTIRDVSLAASRFNLECERDDGKIFNFPGDEVARLLKQPTSIQLNKGR